MPFTPTGNNAMLDAIGITHVSLHSGFPGTGGANEISGGSPAYARGAITFGAAAASERAQGADVVLNVPPSTTLQFVGYWTAATGGNFRGYHPLGNAPVIEFVSDLAADLIRAPAVRGLAVSHAVAGGGAVAAQALRGLVVSNAVAGGGAVFAQVLSGSGPSLFDVALPADRVLSAGETGTVRARPIGDIEADALASPIRARPLGSVTATPTGKVR
jgi:hypothetical protein